MNRLLAWIRSFFGFSRRETNAFLILLPLMFILIFSEPVYRFWFVRQNHDYTKDRNHLDSLMATWKWEKDSIKKESKQMESNLFAFDPNQASEEELIRVGFDQSLAHRIVNYRAKGGKFLVRKDLLKIYGMDSLLFRKLSPFISLPESLSERTELASDKPLLKVKWVNFDLNKADTTNLIKIYGIGPKLSQRIISYRTKLGGFISYHQLNEVYGLDSAVVNELESKSFIEPDFVPSQIDINISSEKELGGHPYIKYKLAKAIIAYRKQHGSFTSVDDLTRITILDENTFAKAKPYLRID